MRSPLISIVLNTFNRAGEVMAAVDSVCSQTFGDWELIVVDDGSTDETPAVLGALSNEKIRIVRHDNVGLTASRNAGARVAIGEWLAFLDDDDTVEPSWLSELLNEAASDVAIVFCGHRRVTPAKETLEIRRPSSLGPAFGDHVGSYLPGTWIMRRSLFENAGEYLAGLTFIHQFELLLRATQVMQEQQWFSRSIDRPLLNYTVRDSSERPMQMPELAVDGGRWILVRHAELLRRDRKWLASHHGVIGVAAVRSGQLDLARRHLWQSLRLEPMSPSRMARMLAALVPPAARRIWGVSAVAPGADRPLERVPKLPLAHLDGEDRFFLPWRYRRNEQMSAESAGAPYWADPSKNNTLYQVPVYRKARKIIRRAGARCVVDVGTGTGVKLERYVGSCTPKVVGVDQPGAIAVAKQRCSSIEWVDGDLMSVALWQGLVDAKPDLVLCADVIEHVEDPSFLLRAMASLLGPNSLLMISTPDRLRFDRPNRAGPPDNLRHVREWTVSEFELLLESAGLVVSHRFRFLPRGYMLSVYEVKRLVWRVLHGKRVPDRRSNMCFLCHLRLDTGSSGEHRRASAGSSDTRRVACRDDSSVGRRFTAVIPDRPGRLARARQ